MFCTNSAGETDPGSAWIAAILLVRSPRALRDRLPQRSRLIHAIFPAPSPAKGFFRLEKLESSFVAGKALI
jgi:hypothetical protein